MAGTEPGERPNPDPARAGRQLDRPPGERYARTGTGTARREAAGASRAARAALVTPLAKSVVAAVAGGAALFVVGGVLASEAGLLFIAGLSGAAVGLLLARAAVPADGDVAALTRRQATWLAIAISIAAVAVGAVATWLNARGEGGSLGLVDYLVQTFGLFIPGELAIAAIGAAWGAGAGPVQG